MAEKSKKKKSNTPKVELRSPDKEKEPSSQEVDEFVAGANRWADKLKPHAGKIVGFIVLFVAAGIGWAVYGWMADKKAMAATSAFSESVELSRTEIKSADDAPEPSTGEPNVDDAPTFTDRKARAAATLAALADAKSLNGPDTLMRAQALLATGSFDDAARAFGQAAKKLPLEASIRALAGIGYAYEAKAEATEDAAAKEQALNGALEAFKTMQPAEDGVDRDLALFHQARILAALGKRDEAIAQYKQVLANHAETALKPDIEARLEMLGSK